MAKKGVKQGAKRGVQRSRPAVKVVPRPRTAPKVERRRTAGTRVQRTAQRGAVNRRHGVSPPRTVASQTRTSLNQRLRRAGVAGAAAATAGAVAASAPRVRRRTVRNAAPPAAVTEEMRSQISSIQNGFNNLQARAQLGAVYDDIGEIEARLTQLPLELDELRERGYVHSGALEDKIVAFDHQWDEVQPRVERTLQQHVRRLDSEFDTVEQRIDALARPNSAAVAAAESAISGLERRVSAAESAVAALYSSVQSELRAIDVELDRVDWVLDQLEASQEIELYDTEGPIAAVEAEWEQDGEEGPDGILYLTDQRLIFEQNEVVAKKKLFGLVATDKETIRKLLLEFPVQEIEEISASEEGGFMGMGKDDILELVCSANAPHSRLRFHLEGQDSEAWAVLLKKVKSGEIDGDRADEYVDEVADAADFQAAFPTQCPSCFAAVEPPARGVVTASCEFCGSTIAASPA